MAAAPYTLSDRFAESGPVLSAWSSLAMPGLAGEIARSGYEAVTVDMQHGLHDEGTLRDSIVEIVRAGACAIARVPVGRFDLASRALDFGADAIIAPMVNSVEDARALAAACKYPPLGERSWGPTAAVALRGVAGGEAFLKTANQRTVCLAMIETLEAFAIHRDILAVDGIDGVFVGPADFSIAWSKGETVNPFLQDMQEAIDEIAKSATEMGKIAGVFAMNPADAPRFAKSGYKLIAAGFDKEIIKAGADLILASAGRKK